MFAVVVYPILHYAERWKGYADLFNQRHPGEVKKSLLLLFCTHAALIGKRFGKHHVRLPLADSRKTWEGSIAMMITSFAAGFTALLLTSPLAWYICLAYAAITAPVAAYVELISHGGNDTVTVPTAVAFILSVLSIL